MRSLAGRVARRWVKRAGWWAIDPETGKGKKPPVNKGGLQNAIPGVDPDEGASYLGDGPLDARIQFIDRIDEMYRAAWDRPVTVAELRALFDIPDYEDEKDSTLWPRNQWVDQASDWMGVPNSVVLSLPQDSLESARHLWQDYRSALFSIEHPPMIDNPAKPPVEPDAALQAFFSHIEASFSLHYQNAKAFVEETPLDKVPNWAKKAALVGTDMAMIYAIAPEQFHHIIEDGEWQKWADQLYGDPDSDDALKALKEMGRIIRQHGGATFGTGADGGWEVKLVDPDGKPIEIPDEQGYQPPYGTAKDYKPGPGPKLAERIARRSLGQ